MTFLKTEVFHPLNKSKPKKIIVLLHGYGGNGKNISLLANFWRRKLKNTIIYCPSAPKKCKNEKNKFKWFTPENEFKKSILLEINFSLKKINQFINYVLRINKLSEKNLVLGGFSQGCMLALQAGLQRKKKFKAIIGFSGKIINQKEIKNKIRSKPNIYLFHGDKDKIVKPKFFFETQKFLKKNKFNLKAKLFKNCDHKIPAAGANLALDILANKL